MARGNTGRFRNNRRGRSFRGGGGGGGGIGGGGGGGSSSGRRYFDYDRNESRGYYEYDRDDGRGYYDGGDDGGYYGMYEQRGNMRPPPLNFYQSGYGFLQPMDYNFSRGMGRFPQRYSSSPNTKKRGGMQTWRGGVSRNIRSKRGKNLHAKKTKSAFVSNPAKSKLMEKDVGITEYISSHEGFNGIIKQRYSDFHVNEITLDGTIAKLTNLKPPEDVEQKKSEEEIIEILTPEVIEKVETMLTEKSEKVEIEVTHKSKDERRKIHEAVKDKFGKQVYSNTEDRGDKKMINIMITKKGDVHDRRSRWPVERGGVYVHFILHKENMDTQETVNFLAGKLGVKPNFITYAGTKDRRASTSQAMSVFKIDPIKLAKLSTEKKNITLGNFSFKPTCLKLGDLKGNRFNICLRNVTGAEEQIEQAMTSLRDFGFINYYGLQRFGNSSTVPTPDVGRALLSGSWKEAIELILKPRDTNDKPRLVQQAIKYWWHSNNAKRAARMLRRSFMNIIECKLLVGLSRHASDDYIGALQNIPRNTRLLYLHSYQSLIWNKIVSRRIKEFGLKPLVGDLVFVNEVEYEEVVDQEGTAAFSDEYPKKPRNKTKKGTTDSANSTTESDNIEEKTGEVKKEKVDNDEVKNDDSITDNAENNIEKKEVNNATLEEEEKKDDKDDNLKEENKDKNDKDDNLKEENKDKNDKDDDIEEPSVESNAKVIPVRAITEEERDNIKIEDVVYPLPGHNVVYPNNVIAEWYKEMLAADGLDSKSMKKSVRQYSVSGTYRRILVRPENLSWKMKHYSNATSSLILSDLDEMNLVPEPEDDPEGKYKALILDFCLPPSTYATMALREVLKVDTSSIHQASLNNYYIKKKEAEKDQTSAEGDKNTESESDKVEKEVKKEAVEVEEKADESMIETNSSVSVKVEEEGTSVAVGGIKRKVGDDDSLETLSHENGVPVDSKKVKTET